MCAKPVIGVPADRRVLEPHPFHMVGEKYLTAIRDGASGLPLVIPALGASVPPDEWLDTVDGILLTGSPSNVEPHRYGGAASREGTWHLGETPLGENAQSIVFDYEVATSNAPIQVREVLDARVASARLTVDKFDAMCA